jgi:GntR family transcriptional regulator
MAPLDFSRVGMHPDVYRWEAIRDVIEEAIASGDIPPRGRVPSEEYICQAAGVTAKTVRRAVRDLRDRGLLYTRAGLGTFASPRDG